jgi:hypothetical protein
MGAIRALVLGRRVVRLRRSLNGRTLDWAVAYGLPGHRVNRQLQVMLLGHLLQESTTGPKLLPRYGSLRLQTPDIRLGLLQALLDAAGFRGRRLIPFIVRRSKWRRLSLG